MGTSLSGLTPATTFDGLLKTSDNDAITSSLKTIGSGDGTDSCLQLSDSALKVNSGAVTIVGVGNTDATTSLLVQNSDGTTLLRVVDDGEVRIGDTTGSLTTEGNNVFLRGTNIYFRERLGGYIGNFREEGFQIGNGSAASAARLQVKGSGATSATTSFLVQNSAGNDALKVTDDRKINFDGEAVFNTPPIASSIKVARLRSQTGTDSIWIQNNTANIGLSESNPTARLHVKGAGNDNTTTSLLVQNSDASASLTYDDSGKVEIVGNSQNGFIQTYGFGAVGFGNESGPAILYGNNLSGVHTNNGYTAFGANSSSSQRVLIKGSGATSATTSLLVQNSAGSNVFSITDDGLFTFNDVGANIDALTIENNNNISKIRYNDNLWLGSSHGTYAPTLKIDRLNGLSVETNSGSLLNLLYDTGNLGIGETTPSAKLHVKAGTTQDSIAKFEDPRATTDYIEIKNDSTLTDYTGLYWGTAAKIRSKQTGAIFLDCTSGILFADGNSARSKIDANGNMSIGTPTIPASTRVTIQGQGATSATTSLLVQNSDGTEHLKITDDGFINARQSIIVNHSTNSSRSLRLGWGSVFATDNASELLIGAVFSQNTAPRITLGGKTRASGADAVIVQALNGMYLSTTAYTEDPSAQLHVKGSGNDNTTTSLLVQNSDGTDLLKVLDDGKLSVSSSVAGGLFATFENTSSTGFGLDIKAGVSSSNYTLQWRNYVGAGGGRIYPDGVIIGTQSTPSARLHIKGSGATSATTALLVENSAGTDTLEVRDDGRVVTGKGATTNANGTFNVLHGVSNLTTRVFTVSRDSVLRGMDINSGGATKISDSSGDQSFSHTATAVLEVSSTTQGFLPPRMTGEQIDAIESPASGLIIYNTTSNKAVCYNGTSWNDMF